MAFMARSHDLMNTAIHCVSLQWEHCWCGKRLESKRYCGTEAPAACSVTLWIMDYACILELGPPGVKIRKAL